jgi:hypothetical protein
VIAGVDATFNGTYTVTDVPNSTSFQYEKTAANVASAASGGTASSSTDDRITVQVNFEDARQTLGMIDPGTWDLYASRVVDGETETVNVCSGNLKISLSSPIITAYTVT